jgi:hypothetical protein
MRQEYLQVRNMWCQFDYHRDGVISQLAASYKEQLEANKEMRKHMSQTTQLMHLASSITLDESMLRTSANAPLPMQDLNSRSSSKSTRDQFLKLFTLAYFKGRARAVFCVRNTIILYTQTDGMCWTLSPTS